ncbi:hypothetical protein ACWCRD_32760 [Streptomyces sp. NPDC002092]
MSCPVVSCSPLAPAADTRQTAQADGTGTAGDTVEINERDGTPVEVYLDKSYNVTATRQEGTEEAENAG